MKTYEEFIAALKSDAELAGAVNSALEDVDMESEEAVEALVKIAEEYGYEVSVENFTSQDEDVMMLDDDDLDMASGGMMSVEDIFFSTLGWGIE